MQRNAWLCRCSAPFAHRPFTHVTAGGVPPRGGAVVAQRWPRVTCVVWRMCRQALGVLCEAFATPQQLAQLGEWLRDGHDRWLSSPFAAERDEGESKRGGGATLRQTKKADWRQTAKLQRTAALLQPNREPFGDGALQGGALCVAERVLRDVLLEQCGLHRKLSARAKRASLLPVCSRLLLPEPLLLGPSFKAFKR